MSGDMVSERRVVGSRKAIIHWESTVAVGLALDQWRSGMGVYTSDVSVVLKVECEERDGVVTRTARLLTPAMDDVIAVYNNLRGLPSMFSATPMRTLRPIVDAMDAGWEILLVDNVGLLAFGTTIIEGHIDVHVTFWDRILRGREQLAREAIDWAMTSSGALGVYTGIPSSSKATIAFAKRVGFQVAGWMLGGAIDSKGQVDDSVVLRYAVND